MKKHIDLVKIMREDYPALYKKLPSPVIKALVRIIREEEMNEIINKYLDDNGVAFTDRLIEEFNIKLDIEGKENLPENGRCFFVANHLYGILDGMILAHTVGNKYGKFMGISNEAFNLIPQLKGLVTSVNAYGRSAKKQILELDKIYKSDVPINHFPAGEVSRKYNKIIEDKEWHKSFVTKAIKEKRDIVPVLFHGRNSKLFYAIHSIRRKLKIAANIELILLPREMFKKRNKTIKVTIGKPISYQILDNSLSHQNVAEKIRQHLYLLKNTPEAELNLK